MVPFKTKKGMYSFLPKEKGRLLVSLTRSSSLILVPFLIFSFNISLILSETANPWEPLSKCGEDAKEKMLDGAFRADSGQLTPMPHNTRRGRNKQPFTWDGARQRQSWGDPVEHRPITGQMRWCPWLRPEQGVKKQLLTSTLSS